MAGLWLRFQVAGYMKLVGRELHVAWENRHFFLLLAAFDILKGGTSGTQQQKFHTDDENQCLHKKSGSPCIPNSNLFNFTFLLVDFSAMLCSSANELQQNSKASSIENNVLHKIACFVIDS